MKTVHKLETIDRSLQASITKVKSGNGGMEINHKHADRGPTDNEYLLYSHMGPKNPSGQIHWYVLGRFRQVALVGHGLLAHSSTSMPQLVPDQPGAHVHS